MKEIRTRFAPSPTGYLHVGGIRTALFAWLLTRQSNGRFILRLEDTDKKREVAGAEEHIEKSLRALGLEYDEGPDIGGPYAPYKQSERLETYNKWAQKLIDAGRAYADPYTPEEIQAFRDQDAKDKKPFLYRTRRPDNPPKWDGKRPLRFKSDPKNYKWHDEVMGDLSTGPEVIDDFVLVKSDGYPTYNFSHIVDDAEMKVTHIIRSQEFIASMPIYLNLYEALGLEPPLIATVPPILGPTGTKKLSKRDGAKDVLDYIRDGYLPDALVSFIATLGWNDGTEQEVFSHQELIDKFSLDRVQRSGARFDEKRLAWANSHFIRQLSQKELYELSKDFLPKSARTKNQDYITAVLGVIQERLKYFSELENLTAFFFERPEFKLSMLETDKKLKKIDHKKLSSLLQTSLTELEKIDFSPEKIRNTMDRLLLETGEKPAVLLGAVRLAVSRAPFSPNLPETLSILGKSESLSRIKEVMLKLNG